jgi:hypothetical protein
MGFEDYTAVATKSSVLWDITPGSPLKVNGLHGVISQRREFFTYYLVPQESATCRYPEPDESSPIIPHFLKIHFNIAFTFTPESAKWSVILMFSN